MGLTRNFHGKKGVPDFFFAVFSGPRKIFAMMIFFASGPPLQVFVNDP